MSWYPTCHCRHNYMDHCDWIDAGGFQAPGTYEPALWADGEPVSEGQCVRCRCRTFAWDGEGGDNLPGIMFQLNEGPPARATAPS